MFFISLDLSAAFDTIDQDIMSTRFREMYGITGLASDWFKSYLQNRKYCVKIDDAMSDVEDLTYGIPQGSVVGPKCFTLYIQPVQEIIRKHGFLYHMYADDIQVYAEFDPCSQTDVGQTLQRLSNCVKDIQNWMFVNKLKLNQDKTEFIIFASPAHHRKLQHVALHLDDHTTISPSDSIRLLGCVLDKHMSMTDQVTSVSKSVNFHSRNISRIRKFIDKDTCHSVVRSLIISRLDYCNSLYNGMTGKNLDRLQKLQNKSARIIHCKPPSTHITPLLKELHWLPVRERIHHKALTLVYKCLHNLSPNYLTNLLKVRQSNYNTRSSSRTPLHTPRTYKSVGDQAFTAFAPKLWNNLPVNLKECTSISTFKKMLKSHLFKP